MDDLTRINGIGKKTAGILAAAGIGSFADLAAVDPKNPPKVELTAPAWADWISEAVVLVEAAADAAKLPQGPAAGDGQGAQDPRPDPGGAKGGGTIADALIVRGPRRGRWRAGRKFGPEPVTIPVADLSLEEIGALQSDPHLSVSETTVEDAG
ncbi:hypothetical protein DDZ14_16130 [Maritimibacter sp. 55A14]|uniref:helix-hairpin-helix domain-containing protein n=1 Tax=Maritimibacter sp. 55A14 TaxID=2174844 RepID=UPI000D61F50E|nr:helix-hairpin-helix domain-containing protein [Maritimibacter sp. 55A14]PWE29969.1 hypothetical protein DDZ14_16130 [Maritimibacter sp. 55A14]